MKGAKLIMLNREKIEAAREQLLVDKAMNEYVDVYVDLDGNETSYELTAKQINVSSCYKTALAALDLAERFRWRDPAVELPLEIGDKGERIILITTMDGEVYPAKFFYNSCDVQKWIVVRGIGWSYPSNTELLEKLPGTHYEAVKAWCYLPEWEISDAKGGLSDGY